MARVRRSECALAIVMVALALVLAMVSSSPQARSLAPQVTSRPPLVENLHTVSPSVLSGGEPHGPDGFAMLRSRGIRTIVSVDGARPDVETARRYGLRYVHVPIGYDGVPNNAVDTLIRVLQECERPVFVHCHHGKHRGPAAAAILAILAGELDHTGGMELLETAGTSHDYVGLWRDVQQCRLLPSGTPLPPLIEAAEPEPLVDAMIRIDACFDELEQSVSQQGENSPSTGSRSMSVTPTADASMRLCELFRESARLAGSDFADGLLLQMEAAEQSALAVAEAAEYAREMLPTRIDDVRRACQRCHEHYRN